MNNTKAKIQVGDVWQKNGGFDYRVTAVGIEQSLVSIDGQAEEMLQNIASIFTSGTLIERNGDPIKPLIPLADRLRKSYPNHDCYILSPDRKSMFHIDTTECITFPRDPEGWEYIIEVWDGEPGQLSAYSDDTALNYIAVIIPKQNLIDRIRAQYPDFEVVELEWHGDKLLRFHRFNCDHLHIDAQSMKGFYEYVYLEPDAVWHTTSRPTVSWESGATLQPIAVLFSRGES